VALKILEKNKEDYEELLHLMRNEAFCTRLANHPGIVKVIALEEDEHGARLVMELMEGGSLHDLIVSGLPITEERVLTTGLQIIDPLSAVVAAGMVHRDIKPANILFDSEGGGKLSDFGLACGTVALPVDRSHLLATPDYVAPEILNGFQGDLRSDLYSLGGCLYHVLTGAPPYLTEGLSTQDLQRIKSFPVEMGWWNRDPACSETTGKVISRMMDPNPEARYQSCAEVEIAMQQTLRSLKKNSGGFLGIRRILFRH
jgi:serine/threonine-protein kinase